MSTLARSSAVAVLLVLEFALVSRALPGPRDVMVAAMIPLAAVTLEGLTELVSSLNALYIVTGLLGVEAVGIARVATADACNAGVLLAICAGLFLQLVQCGLTVHALWPTSRGLGRAGRTLATFGAGSLVTLCLVRQIVGGRVNVLNAASALMMPAVFLAWIPLGIVPPAPPQRASGSSLSRAPSLR